METLRAEAEKLGVHLNSAQVEQFRRYHEELVDWNARVNLTSVTDREEVESRHFVDSLTVCTAIPKVLLESGRFVDVGSGAGFPGLPLKVAFPGLRATLIDSTAKKTAFLTSLIDVLGVVGVEVLTGRAETLAHDPELREAFDFVLARAVASVAVLSELALPFCRTGGLVIAQKGTDIDAEVRRSRRAIETMGGALKEVNEIAVESRGAVMCLVVLEKVGQTPARYPRRPGIPRKRPL